MAKTSVINLDECKVFVPNWFHREHIERFAGEKFATQDHWIQWVYENQYKLCDFISEVVEDYVSEIGIVTEVE